MITINTNVNNLKLQRNLNSVNSAMQNALNRISTGYKINNASDDAAGLVISKALDVQNRGLDVANQNAQMATNLLSVADGALGQMGELTMRIRDLATQSANGGYSDSERKALSLEAKELTNNLEQLVKGTKFNDYNIFEGSSGSTKEITTEAEAIAQGYEIVKTAEELKAILTALDALGKLTGSLTPACLSLVRFFSFCVRQKAQAEQRLEGGLCPPVMPFNARRQGERNERT